MPETASDAKMSPVSKPRTGVVFDDRMAGHYNPWDANFIECPDRYLASVQRCKDYDLIDRCTVLPSRSATEEELKLVHDRSLIESVKQSKDIKNIQHLEELSSFYDSVYFNDKTYESALLAAGSTLELVSSVLKGEVDNGLAIVRPPGHHAMQRDACGFCFFNNVAIATKFALKHFGLSRVLIVDWDVHHGQATQRIFYDDPRVLYFSIHRYENGKFWPHLRESNFDYCGGETSKGLNINIPLNATGQGNAEYLAIFNNVLLPAAYEFCPELVIVSAGFDAALGCPEGEMKVSPAAYSHLLNSLMPLAQGHVCVVLEGGYCIPSLSESVAMCLKTLLGDPCPPIPPCSDINHVTADTILNALTIQRNHWCSLNLQSVYHQQETSGPSDARHVAVVEYTGNPLENVSVFETRSNYPVQSPSVVADYKVQIAELIAKTNFSVPYERTVFGATFKDSGVNEGQSGEVLKSILDSGLQSKLIARLPMSSGGLSETLARHGFKNVVLSTFNQLSPLPALKTYSCPKESCPKECAFEGSLLHVVDAIASNASMNGFALISPRPETCVYDSTKAAAEYLLSSPSMKVKRILLVDWSASSSFRAQEFFMEDNRVLYVSLCGSGVADDAGRDRGEGYSMNIPLGQHSGDGDYVAAFFHLVLPVAYEFSPDFIMVSAGCGAEGSDTPQLKQPSPICQGLMIRLLNSLANGRLSIAFEAGKGSGGSDSSSAASVQCISALLGCSPSGFSSVKPSTEGIEAIKSVRQVHRKFWKCLKFDVLLPTEVTPRSIEPSPTSSDPQQANGATVLHVDFRGSSAGEPNVPMDTTELFCVAPLQWCPHLELAQPLPAEGLDPRAVCEACMDPTENWVCLQCYRVLCGRFINQHMVEHGTETGHVLALSYSDLSVWCYGCDSYVHNALLGGITDHAAQRKFN